MAIEFQLCKKKRVLEAGCMTMSLHLTLISGTVKKGNVVNCICVLPIINFLKIKMGKSKKMLNHFTAMSVNLCSHIYTQSEKVNIQPTSWKAGNLEKLRMFKPRQERELSGFMITVHFQPF